MPECANCGEIFSPGLAVCPMCGTEAADVEAVESVDVKRIRGATKHRFLAAYADNILAIITAFGIASQLESLGELQQGLVAYGLYLAYYLAFETLFAATPAKSYFRLRIVRLNDGRRIGAGAALVRTLFRIVEANPLVGWLPAGILILVTRRKQRLGDLVAGSVVVRN